MIIIFKFVSTKYKNQRTKAENMLELAVKHFRDSSITLLNLLDKYINILAKFTQFITGKFSMIGDHRLAYNARHKYLLELLSVSAPSVISKTTRSCLIPG